jgi:DNA-binding NtrC family response regulator
MAAVQLRPLISQLTLASTFQDAAHEVLKALMDVASECIGESRFAPNARLRRGLVHLRGEAGYAALSIREAQGGTAPLELTPSNTIWQNLSLAPGPVALDVIAGIATRSSGQTNAVTWARSGGLDESRARLLGRGATHVLAFPLLEGGKMTGMVSLEAECHAAIAEPFVWQACIEDLSLIVQLARPFLLAAPLQEAAESSRDPLMPVIGSAMKSRIEVLQLFVQQNETILLCGPTGSGKSRLARWIHANSARSQRPFEVVDLSTVPENMQMPELFGWKKGSFTGAVADNPGRVFAAEHGTLFIDEIDKLSLAAQAGLLQLFEDRTYRALGSTGASRTADVRLVVGTNIDLTDAVKAGRVREDLYYRINVLPVRLPSLAERKDEIPAWAAFMAGEHSSNATVSAEACQRLVAQEWPGNLRQLRNVMNRAIAMANAEASGGGPVVVGAHHVERALDFEGTSRAAAKMDLADELRRVARLYAADAERRRHQGRTLPLDLADAFSGMVLEAGVELTGDLAAAFRLFGEDGLVQARNHHKSFDRARAKLQAALELELRDKPSIREV